MLALELFGGFVFGEEDDEAGDFGDGHGGGVDEDRVLGAFEGGSFAFDVAKVALADFFESAGKVDLVAALLMLAPASFGAHVGRGGEVNFQVGVGEDDGADVAAFHDYAAKLAGAALFGDEDAANTGNHSNF